MFIIELNYKVSLERIDAILHEHVVFLEKYYAAGIFFASGRKVPRSGGFIFATGKDRTDLMKIITEDPFYKYQMADYTVTEMLVTKKADRPEAFIN